MKPSVRLRTWLADRSSAFEHPRLYRQGGEAPARKRSMLDAIALAGLGIALLGMGICFLIGGLFLIWLIFIA